MKNSDRATWDQNYPKISHRLTPSDPWQWRKRYWDKSFICKDFQVKTGRFNGLNLLEWTIFSRNSLKRENFEILKQEKDRKIKI